MAVVNKEYISNWAYDLSIVIVDKGEIYDIDVINQNIQSILSTFFGERMFKLNFGSELGNTLFEAINETTGENLLTSIINSIKFFENRAIVYEDDCRIFIDYENNALTISIPYRINKRQIVSEFKKKIYL